MEPQAKHDCLAWLSDTASIELNWTRELSKAADKAAAEGRIQVLLFLAESARRDNSYLTLQILDTSQCVAAAAAGQIAVLAWLQDHVDSVSWDINVCLAAVRAGQMEALQWLTSVCNPRCPYNEYVLEEAASHGKLNCIQVLRSLEPPCPWGPGVCAAAVNHPECLKWLRAQDPPCEWHERCSAYAAQAGDLSLLMWMQGQGCPLHSRCIEYAAGNGDISMMEWLLGHEPNDTPFEMFDCVYSAAEGGHFEAVRWLRSLRPPAPWAHDCLDAAACHGASHDQLVQWMLLQEPPCPWQPDILQTYAAAGNLAMLQWLHKAGHHADVHAAVCAARAGQVAVLGWLLSIRENVWESLPFQPEETWPVPTLMLWADRLQGCKLGGELHGQLQQARATYCALHGLVRWRRNQLLLSSSSSSSIRDSSLATGVLLDSTVAGQQLLTHLARLPNDLVIRIAVAAELQHDQPI